jgi:DNA-binding CsgD family transcriptional regulator
MGQQTDTAEHTPLVDVVRLAAIRGSLKGRNAEVADLVLANCSLRIICVSTRLSLSTVRELVRRLKQLTS